MTIVESCALLNRGICLSAIIFIIKVIRVEPKMAGIIPFVSDLGEIIIFLLETLYLWILFPFSLHRNPEIFSINPTDSNFLILYSIVLRGMFSWEAISDSLISLSVNRERIFLDVLFDITSAIFAVLGSSKSTKIELFVMLNIIEKCL